MTRCFQRDEMIEGEVTSAAVRELVRVRVHPGAGRRRDRRRADPGVGRLGRPAAGRAGAHLRRDVPPLRPHDRRGQLPVPPGRTSRASWRPGSATASCSSTRPGGSSTTRPTACRPCTASASTRRPRAATLAEVGLDDEMVRDAYAFGIPVTHEVERPSGVTVVVRCIPLLERGEATGARRAHPGHQRAAPPGPAAAVQGRHHPRDPPPGEEQPADDLARCCACRPGAWTNPEAQAAIEESVRPHPLHRHGPRDPQPGGGRGRAVRRGPAAAAAHGRGGPGAPRLPGEVPHRGRRRQAARPSSPRRCRSSSPSWCRTSSSTPTRSRTTTARRARCCGAGATTASADRAGRPTTGSACPPASTSTRTTGLGLSIVQTLVTTELAGLDHHAGAAPRATHGADCARSGRAPCGWPDEVRRI